MQIVVSSLCVCVSSFAGALAIRKKAQPHARARTLQRWRKWEEEEEVEEFIGPHTDPPRHRSFFFFLFTLISFCANVLVNFVSSALRTAQSTA